MRTIQQSIKDIRWLSLKLVLSSRTHRVRHIEGKPGCLIISGVMLRCIPFIVAVGILTGCNPGRIIPSLVAGPLSIRVMDSEITLSNNTEEMVYFVIYPSEILPLIEWYPCNHPDLCGDAFIKVGSSITKDIDLITEDTTEELTIFWWHLEGTNGEDRYQISDFSEISVIIR